MKIEALKRSGLALLLLLLVSGFTAGCGSDSTSGTTTSGPPVEVPPDPDPDPDPDPEPKPEPDPNGCDESFDGAYDAIQNVIFERHGCTAQACHGSSAAGGLELTADVSYDNLVRADSVGSSLRRVEPTRVKDSYLFHKLASATDPSLVTIDIAGSPMPLSGGALSPEELDAVRLWIEGAAPREGSIGDEFGGNRVAELLDTCLPDPDPVVIEPLEPPAAGTGVQMAMPPHQIPGGAEFEVCFAEYIDFREQIPEEFRTADGNFFFANGSLNLADPNTHHMTISYSGFGAEMVDAPEFGRWECAAGPLEGESCDPLDPSHCGGGQCRSELQNSVACLGFGPPGGGSGVTPGSRIRTGNGRPGFFAKLQSHGIFYWNSHAFNLTPKDLTHHNYTNIYFTDDLRFQDVGFQDTSNIGIAAGTPPFAKVEYCAEHVLARGTELLSLVSHTHKRGERFTMTLKSTGELLYDNPFWDDPVFVNYDPARVFDSEDPDDRTIIYCAVYNNGVAPDGSPDVGSVTRLSRKPARSSCRPVACAEGLVGEPCAGVNDDAACDTSPGAGDGMCDACSISGGLTSDDEMFILLGSTLEVVG
ncbi:MAG: hypothetical protein P8R42_29825 [Candidatus Binatia bacterium]|nr:hypothetical protein [Candidatus Binatia bacterium]